MQINRPDMSNYEGKFFWRDDRIKAYLDDLESYCDYLEKCLKEKEAFIDSLTSEKPLWDPERILCR